VARRNDLPSAIQPRVWSPAANQVGALSWTRGIIGLMNATITSPATLPTTNIAVPQSGSPHRSFFRRFCAARPICPKLLLAWRSSQTGIATRWASLVSFLKFSSRRGSS
jgi:hypothetical protein